MRARNIKPAFFTNDELAELSPITRLLFIGMWCMADRSGRMKDRPKKIKAEVLPFDDCNVEQSITDLAAAGFITRYAVEGNNYIQISKFEKHQHPHVKEAVSEIPPVPDEHHTSTVLAPDSTGTNPPDCGLLIVDCGLRNEDCGLLIPDSVETPKATRLTIQDIAFLFNDSFGSQMPRGCNNMAVTLCSQFTADAIRNAFEVAAKHGVMNMAYVEGVLRGTGKPKPKNRDAPKTFEEIKMDNTKRAMMEFIAGGENDRSGQAAICINDGRSIGSVPARLQ